MYIKEFFENYKVVHVNDYFSFFLLPTLSIRYLLFCIIFIYGSKTTTHYGCLAETILIYGTSNTPISAFCVPQFGKKINSRVNIYKVDENSGKLTKSIVMFFYHNSIQHRISLF